MKILRYIFLIGLQTFLVENTHAENDKCPFEIEFGKVNYYLVVEDHGEILEKKEYSMSFLDFGNIVVFNTNKDKLIVQGGHKPNNIPKYSLRNLMLHVLISPLIEDSLVEYNVDMYNKDRDIRSYSVDNQQLGVEKISVVGKVYKGLPLFIRVSYTLNSNIYSMHLFATQILIKSKPSFKFRTRRYRRLLKKRGVLCEK